MPQLIIAILALFLIIAAITAAIGALVVSLPAAFSMFAMAGTYALLRGAWFSRPGSLAKVAKPYWNGTNLTWSLNEDAVRRCDGDVLIAVLAFALGMSLAIRGLPGMVQSMWGKSENQELWTLASGVISCGFLGYAAVGVQRMTARIVLGNVQTLIQRLEQTTCDTSELGRIDAETSTFCQQMGFSWPFRPRQEVETFIQQNQAALLRDPAVLAKQVVEIVRLAQLDREKLRDAARTYSECMEAFRDASREANRAGIITLMAELEAIHEALTSRNLMELLSSREWKKFREICRDAQTDLQRIAKTAPEFSEACAGDRSSFAVESDFEKACRILDVTATATGDEVKKAFRHLCKDFHPDQSPQTTPAVRTMIEERQKQINWAYAVLKQHLNV